MDYKKLSLSKMSDALVKAMDAKEHFDKKEKKPNQDPYIDKVKVLKETLAREYKSVVSLNSDNKYIVLKAGVIEKHIDYIKKIQNNKTFDISDRQIIDRLLIKYGVES
jgi:hypothetical protein